MISKTRTPSVRSAIITTSFILTVLVIIAYYRQTRLRCDVSFQAAEAFSGNSIGSDCTEVLWASERVLLASAGNNRIQAFDPASGKELWCKKFDIGVGAVTCNSLCVFVMLEAQFSDNAEPIRRLDLATGKDTTPEGVPKPFLVRALVWSNELDALCAVAHEEVWIYSADLLSVTRRIPYNIHFPKVTSDGRSVLLAQHNGSCARIDLKSGLTDHLHGPPSTPNSARSMVTMDAPFLSNAFHSTSGPLIRIVDNSWAKGQIFFHRTSMDIPIEKDSKNGHAVAAIHWPSQQLAVSGTEQNLLLFSTTGKRLAKRSHATSERTYSIAFSPSGKKIATLSQNGSIRVFSGR